MRRSVGVLLLGTTVLTAGAAQGVGVAGSAADRPAIGKLTVGHRGLFVHATLGSFCFRPPGDEPGSCGDSIYPIPTRGQLPVTPGGRVVLTTGVRARKVSVQLVRLEGNRDFTTLADRRARRAGKSRRRWRARLPRDLRGADVLDVDVVWRNRTEGSGDANFWAGIR